MENYSLNRSSSIFTFGKYLKLIWHWSWLVVAAAVVSACIAFGASKFITPVYKATTTIMVNGQAANETVSYATMEMNVQLAQTYAQMITQTPVLEEVAKKVGVSAIDPESITAEALTSMPLVTITVESKNPGQAAKIANSLVSVFQDQEKSLDTQRNIETENNILVQIDEIENKLKNANIKLSTTILDSDKELLKARIANYQEIYSGLLTSYENIQGTISNTTTNIIQVEPATTPLKPDRPKTLLNVGIAFLVGFGLAISLIYILGLIDTTLKTPEEFFDVLGIPVIGTISKYSPNKEQSIIDLEPFSKTREDFYSLRARFNYLTKNTEDPLQTIMVVSPSSNDGTTTIAINLCRMISQEEKEENSCIIDMNLRRPQIHELLGISQSHGLSDFISGKEKSFPDKYLKKVDSEPFRVITAGKVSDNPQEIIHSPKFLEMINKVKASSGMIFLDTPPALAVSDAFDLLPFVDGVLVVMKSGRTKIEEAQKTIELLKLQGANIIGIVVNQYSGEKKAVYGAAHNSLVK